MLSEAELIARLRATFDGGPAKPAGTEGIGDDAAVFPGPDGSSYVLTTDFLVEGVDFRRDWISPRELGRRAIEVSLSDIAAMGARPRFAFLSAAFPPDFPDEQRLKLFEGVQEGAREANAWVLGGDLSRAGELSIGTTLVGEVARDRVRRRGDAKAGDAIFVTGPLGSAKAGLELLVAGAHEKGGDDARLVEAQLAPRADLEAGLILASLGRGFALMDVSDGLAADLPKMARASGDLGFEVDIERLPVAPELIRHARERKLDARADYAWIGGEDFALLGACRPEDEAALTEAFAKQARRLVFVGRFTEPGSGYRLKRGDQKWEAASCGFDHFVSRGSP